LARSPDVAALNAPQVSLSKWAISEVLFAGVDGTWSLLKRGQKMTAAYFRRELESKMNFLLQAALQNPPTTPIFLTSSPDFFDL
jgi:hypothetical protein